MDRWFKTLAIQLEEDSKEKNLAKDTKDVLPCVMCAKIHDLEQCKASDPICRWEKQVFIN